MPNNNPDGYNAFGGPMEHETPYGEVERLKTLSRAAPNMPEASPSPLEAPRRAQRHATGQRGQEVPPAPVPVPVVVPVDQFWTQLAAEPGASDLVKAMAGGP